MGYAAQAATALRMVTAKGAAVSFTLTSPGTYDPTTDTYSDPTTTTVSGYAVQADAIKLRRAGETIGAANTVLIFTPTTRGQLPAATYSVTWQSTTQSVVRTFGEVDPDGQGALMAYVELAR